jgi:hypothetical protein
VVFVFGFCLGPDKIVTEKGISGKNGSEGRVSALAYVAQNNTHVEILRREAPCDLSGKR